MDYTVSDFYNTFGEKLLLLAGRGGLSRGVSGVGILDYELDPSVKDRYICDNFHSGMIVVATFLYAKKNPYLIGDAVRHLIGKGCSGLLIRNVFRLPIPETVLKYADSKDFPILLVNGSGVYFEDFVYEVRRRHEQMENIREYEDELNMLLSGGLSGEALLRCVKSVIPSLKPSYFIAYAIPAVPLGADRFLHLMQEYRQSELFDIANKLIKFGDHLLFVFSSDTLSQDYGKDIWNRIYALLSSGGTSPVQIGISAPHYYFMEFRDAILEGRYAANCQSSEKEGYTLYNDLGVYQLLLPYCHSKDFVRFSDRILDPIRDYDTENGTALFETLLRYVENDADLKKTAELLSQHENTIRYRLEKIHSICGLSYRTAADGEQISLAAKIHMARGLLPEEC